MVLQPPSAQQVPAKEGKDLLPGVHGLLRAIGGPVVVPEAVARTVVPVELVCFTMLLQFCLKPVDVFGRRVLVVIAEESQQRRR